jgi:hypothetical protein
MRVLDYLATAAALGVFGYFVWKIILPKLGDLQLPSWQPPQFQPQQQPETPQLPSTPPSSPTSTALQPTDPKDVDPPATKSTNTLPAQPETKQSPAPPSSPPPTGQTLWTSQSWSNGKPRLLNKHEMPDPYDPRLTVAAGKCKNLQIDGKGNAFLSCHQSRMYIQVNHFDAEMRLSYIHNPTLDTNSLRLISRHELDFGGAGLYLKRNTATVGYEIEHGGDHPDVKSVQLPQPLSATNWTHVRWGVKHMGTGLRFYCYLNYGSGGWVKVLDYTDPQPPAIAMNKNLLLSKSWAWLRTNNEDTGDVKNVQYRDVSISAI